MQVLCWRNHCPCHSSIHSAIFFFIYCRNWMHSTWWHSGKESARNAEDERDVGSISGLERSLEIENGNQLQYSCLDNSMEREAWWATVHGVAKSWTWLSRWATHTHAHTRHTKKYAGIEEGQVRNHILIYQFYVYSMYFDIYYG